MILKVLLHVLLVAWIRGAGRLAGIRGWVSARWAADTGYCRDFAGVAACAATSLKWAPPVCPAVLLGRCLHQRFVSCTQF